MGSYHITVLKGDGIGPDVVTEAMGVLECVGKKYGHDFVFNEKLAGGCAYDAYGEPLPEETLEACKNSDAILLGAVGGPKWDHLPANLRPEAGALLKLRSSLGLYANLRPAIIQGFERRQPHQARNHRRQSGYSGCQRADRRHLFRGARLS